MPFPMKVQPIDSLTMGEPDLEADSAKPAFKSRLLRLFHRQFPGVLRVSSAEKPIATACEGHRVASAADFELSTVCLVKMVQNFIEESNDKQSAAPTAKCGRNRGNCFNGNSNDSSDDEFDPWNESAYTFTYGDSSDTIKSLISCSSMEERNLLADASKIVEQQSKNFKRKDDLRATVTEGLSALGYDASICKSRWEKSSSHPAGEYEYIDVILNGGGRLLIDVDFRSEFEIARSTGAYEAILQSLPFIFVGETKRLQQIVSVVSEAASKSLEKKGMHTPPWRKSEYMKAKWLSPYSRDSRSPPPANVIINGGEVEGEFSTVTKTEIEVPELQLIYGEKSWSDEMNTDEVVESALGEEAVVQSPWQPPALTPRSCERRTSRVTGLSSLFKETL